MTRLVDFADGFSAAAPPDVTPGAQEDFIIANNQAVATDLLNSLADQLTMDDSRYLSAIVSYELERFDDDNTYRQTGEFVIVKDPTIGWKIEYGNYVGTDMLQVAAISQAWHVLLSIDTVTGEVDYESGNMTGANYEGTLRTIITRILT